VVAGAAQSVSFPPAAPSTPPAFDGGLIDDALGQLARLGERGGPVNIDGRTLRITNPDKVYWPESGVTKRDMIAHYLRMAPLMLPYLRDRPIGMQMFPDGIGGKHFWRKDRPPHTPDWVPTWVHERGPTSTTYIVADHPATLGFVANLGAIDIHPWHSRIDAPDKPDWAVFDLDPFEPMTFAEVVEIARLVRASLDFYALHSVIKTSGQTGLQIYVPLRRGPGYDRVRGWVEEVARAIGRIVPDKITWQWEVARRGGKLRIDYTQNILNKTLTAPYSVRPEKGAPVSAPIGWEELDDPALRPNRWTITTIGKRIAERGDLFVELLTQDQDLPGAA
jgi:bifunctional non-homologous end joining protein LigD